MSEEKKAGPVVIRKGHVKPPPPGAKIEPPEVEVLAPAEKSEKPDPRPLWQRLAEEKAGAPGAGAAAAPGPRPSPAPGAPRRGPPRGDRPRDPRPGDRGDRPERPRRDRDAP